MFRTIANSIPILAIGCAVLLGPDHSSATDKLLDGTENMVATPDFYAWETIDDAVDLDRGLAVYPLKSPALVYGIDGSGTGDHPTHKFTVRSRWRIGSELTLFVRLDLGGGMLFRTNTDTNAGVDAGLSWQQDDETGRRQTDGAKLPVTAGGGQGDTYIVYRLKPDNNRVLPRGGAVSIHVHDDLAVPKGTGEYTASISAYRGVDDALIGVNASNAFSGQAVVVRVIAGVGAEVNPGETAVADIGEGYLWFAKSGPNGQTNTALLGNAKIVAGNDGRVLNAKTGNRMTLHEVLPNGIDITVEGDFSVGAFNLGGPAASQSVAGVVCPAEGGVHMEAPITGNLAPTGDDPNSATLNSAALATGQNPSFGLFSQNYSICVQVDTQGPNTKPIPATTYVGKISVPAETRRDAERELASGVIGRIGLSGTKVNLAYLTTWENYRQRLIIVNRGEASAAYRFVSFQPEEGKTVELTPDAMAAQELGENVVEPNSRLVLRVYRILNVSGESTPGGSSPRTAATLFFEADPGDIQVATFKVNLIDGSTDTVIYPSEAGVEEVDDRPGPEPR